MPKHVTAISRVNSVDLYYTNIITGLDNYMFTLSFRSAMIYLHIINMDLQITDIQDNFTAPTTHITVQAHIYICNITATSNTLNIPSCK